MVYLTHTGSKRRKKDEQIVREKRKHEYGFYDSLFSLNFFEFAGFSIGFNFPIYIN